MAGNGANSMSKVKIPKDGFEGLYGSMAAALLHAESLVRSYVGGKPVDYDSLYAFLDYARESAKRVDMEEFKLGVVFYRMVYGEDPDV